MALPLVGKIMKNRPLPDVIIIIIAFTAALVILLTGMGIVAIEIFHPRTDTTDAASYVADVEKLLLTVVLGYVSGRQVSNKDNKAGQERRDD